MMERLTSKKEADAQRKAYERRLEQGYPRNIPEERFLRLSAYEDTGLTPEEITDFLPTLKEWRQNMGALRHVHELVTAESEGRLIVLPCKVGDTVWVTSAYFRDFNSPVEARVKRIEINNKNSLVPVQLILWMDIGDGYKEYGCKLDSIGMIVFLTRDEAEAALKEEV